MSDLLRVEGLSKRFPGVVALEHVSFDLQPGEVHVLLGENGAGKSTLIKCLAGVHTPDEGRILVDGRYVSIRSAAESERLGIATIHQEFNLVPQLTVAENVLLGRQPRRLGIIDRKEMSRRATEALAQIGLALDPRAPVSQLGVARRQLVEIAKALSLHARVLILDEPTATLTGAEVDRLFEVMTALRERGVGLIFISHHLEEIGHIGDRVTVLRDGRTVDTVPASTDQGELVRLMVGRTIEARYPRVRSQPGPALLQVRGLSSPGRFEGVSFDVHEGEVVGLAGLVGAGRTELARAIFGADRYGSGTVEVAGQRVMPHSIAAALRAGIGLVPEDRKGQGLVLKASVVENLGLATLDTVTRWGVVDRRLQRKRAADISRRLQIRMAGLDQVVGSLSGGNQQKVVIGKWLSARSRVLILDEPTRGVDVGAKVEIYELINELTGGGHAVVLISSDLPEVLGMADRVLVMARGRIVGELPADEADQDKVMSLAVKEVEATGVR